MHRFWHVAVGDISCVYYGVRCVFCAPTHFVHQHFAGGGLSSRSRLPQSSGYVCQLLIIIFPIVCQLLQWIIIKEKPCLNQIAQVFHFLQQIFHFHVVMSITSSIFETLIFAAFTNYLRNKIGWCKPCDYSIGERRRRLAVSSLTSRCEDDCEDLRGAGGVLGGHWRRWRRALLGRSSSASSSIVDLGDLVAKFPQMEEVLQVKRVCPPCGCNVINAILRSPGGYRDRWVVCGLVP